MSTQSHIDKVNLKPNILPYGHHVGAPAIKPQELSPFKNNGIKKVDNILKKRYDEILKQAEELQNLYILNQEIYNSKYNFEPIVGNVYHLYQNSEDENFLSIIEPSEWNKKHLCSVILNSDMTWTKI